MFERARQPVDLFSFISYFSRNARQSSTPWLQQSNFSFLPSAVALDWPRLCSGPHGRGLQSLSACFSFQLP